MEQQDTIYVGPLHTKHLIPSDMVIPLFFSICIYLVYIGLLIPITVLFYSGYDSIDSCVQQDYQILISSLFATHVIILIISILAIYQSFNAKTFGTNRYLNWLMTFRVLFNFVEIILILYGFYAIFLDRVNSKCWEENVHEDDPMYILVVSFLSFNVIIFSLTWCCLICCLSSNRSNNSHNDDDIPCLHKFCACCVYNEQAAKQTSQFYGLGGLINILAAGTNYSASQIMTGLHLIRMLQKHYGTSDDHYASNVALKIKQVKDKKLLSEAAYYALYANAAYGIPLYTMSKPCAICCAPPCCLPIDDDDGQIIDDGDRKVLRKRSCHSCLKIDNSSLKVFIQRTECAKENVLLVNQYGGLHNVNFYVVVDHNQKALVISIRGTLSLGDTITDANTEPELFDEIKTDEPCYVHAGIGKCAKNTFKKIMQSKAILEFVQDEQYKKYDLIICGHSLGAGTTVLLSLMMKYGNHEHLKYFINEHRRFRAYALAPPACVNREFAKHSEKEVSEFLTCVVYGHDLIPRLSFYALIWTQAAITVLLNELKETEHGPWHVYRKSLRTKKDTITNILPSHSKYFNDERVVYEEKQDDGTDTESLLPRSSGEVCFMQEVEFEMDRMRTQYAERLSTKWKEKHPDDVLTESAVWKKNDLLWNTQFSQIGRMLHVLRDDDEHENENGACSCCTKYVLFDVAKRLCSNFCRCRCCLDPEDTKYKILDVGIDTFSNKLIFSGDMMPDHMPHLYLDVLQRLGSALPEDFY